MELKNWFGLFLYALLLSHFLAVAQIQLLPEEEVEALETIFTKLHFNHEHISRNFCNTSAAQNVTSGKPIKILVQIDCSCSGTLCHVTNIRMKGLNLYGTLPQEFSKLSRLKEIDLTRNYINGTIPLALTKIPLNILSLSANRVSGLIPNEIGNMATLEQMLLSSNNFTGTIPETFGKLKNLTDFRIVGCGLRGKIPGLIGNWTKITILDMQGTSMEGPIPDSLSQLKDVKELRISDLTGLAMTTKFPNLSEMKNLEKLVLRNCKITGPIPEYIGALPNLMLLDLSYNLLAGKIPRSLPNTNLKHLFLNNNSLNGPFPNWMTQSNSHIDISYNNFTEPSSITSCTAEKLNAVSSLESAENKTLTWCLKKDLPCSATPKCM